MSTAKLRALPWRSPRGQLSVSLGFFASSVWGNCAVFSAGGLQEAENVTGDALTGEEEVPFALADDCT